MAADAAAAVAAMALPRGSSERGAAMEALRDGGGEPGGLDTSSADEGESDEGAEAVLLLSLQEARALQEKAEEAEAKRVQVGGCHEPPFFPTPCSAGAFRELAAQHRDGLASDGTVIESRWVSNPLALAGKLRPRRLIN
jgi:hypothetical protein